MNSYLLKWTMFISSYLPLYILLVLINVPNIFKDQKITIMIWSFLSVVIALIIISIATLLFIVKKKTNTEVPVLTYEKTDDNIISYIMTYLIPVLSIDLSNIWNVIANLLLFLIIGIIYVRNDLVYLNPLLSLLGFYVYRSERGSYIITKVTLETIKELRNENKMIGSYKLTEGVFLYKKLKK
ncbi:hypothetical protein [Listeria booriae]|uniref:Uncharacterized protein n=1 Tax=Listeria booriae TaxID=1552123 RepID=A0A7X1CL88_9LIST|nr:hypothetical protein [Listeria booriae]MBC1792865.1 hypothetical protein [Listeria booriae]MBC1797434.1 hypothetical protein [Listeria booriae]MBC1812016.1 hypothetical protein [Listeria booriae]MBC2319678.1 hypothetical protein [Listeria booriae]